MSLELVTEEDFDSFPEDPEARFAALESCCRRSLGRIVGQTQSQAEEDFAKLQYMSIVSSAAFEVGLSTLSYPSHDYPLREFDDFAMRAVGEVTRIRFRQGGTNHALSVKLSNRNRGRLELEIRRLKDIVQESSLPLDKRKFLLDKLDELSTEIKSPRVQFGRVLAVLAYVGAGVVGGTDFFANAPQAIATIMSLIGNDKMAEENEARRLGPPPIRKALPSPQAAGLRASAPQSPVSLASRPDDDIPF